jgi:hypothetical protein
MSQREQELQAQIDALEKRVEAAEQRCPTVIVNERPQTEYERLRSDGWSRWSIYWHRERAASQHCNS